MNPVYIAPRPGKRHDQQQSNQVNDVEEDVAPGCQSAEKGDDANDNDARSSIP
jgi:hypothetical protein